MSSASLSLIGAKVVFESSLGCLALPAFFLVVMSVHNLFSGHRFGLCRFQFGFACQGVPGYVPGNR